jgi:hypothetical protein
MQTWPTWFPTPKSWVSAIGILTLMAVIQHVDGYFWTILFPITQIFPSTIYILSLVSQIFPILIISFVHHWLGRLLNTYFPESQIAGEEPITGDFPSLLSWWKGFYGWLVVYLSLFLTILVVGIFTPYPDYERALSFANNGVTSQLSWIGSIFIRTTIAAYLCYFEYLVHLKIVSNARN